MKGHCNKGHSKAGKGRNFCFYTIYDNKTDQAIVYDSDARTCAKAMGITLAGFYSLISRSARGKVKRRTIVKRYADEEE